MFRPIMARIHDLSDYVSLLFVCSNVVAFCAINVASTAVTVPNSSCQPCHANTISNRGRRCPDLVNVTHTLVQDLVQDLDELLYKFEHTKNEAVHANVGFEPKFHNMSVLRDVKMSSIGPYIKGRNIPEKLLHRSYAYLTLLSAYIDWAEHIVIDHHLFKMRHGGSIKEIKKLLRTTMCNMYDHFETLGVRKINKNVCKYSREKIRFDDDSEAIQKALSILNHGVEIVKYVKKDIEELKTATSSCRYVKCNKRVPKLKCDKKQTRSLKRNGRKERKEQKERKGRKEQKKRNRKNKGRSCRCGKIQRKRKCKNGQKKNRRCRSKTEKKTKIQNKP